MAHVPAIVRQYLFFPPVVRCLRLSSPLEIFMVIPVPRFSLHLGVLVIMHRNISDSSLKQLF